MAEAPGSPVVAERSDAVPSTPAPAFAVRDAARLTDADAPGFAAFALRTRASGAREVLARRASGGTRSRADLVEAIGREGADAIADPLWGAWFAHVEALLPGTEPATAVALLDAAASAASDGGTQLPTPVADIRAQTLLRAGARTEAADALASTPLSDGVRWEVECDLANPHLWPGLDLDEQAWLAVLSRPFVAGGVEPVTVSAEADTPFGRLRALAQPATPSDTLTDTPSDAPTGEDGLVSVVMSAYQPDRDIIAACRSILDQSWSNLELLVVDDASPPGSEALLAEVAALDPRVRVLHAPTNGGTYQVRNLALREARGAFMTFQDSDDWSHPRRIEVQVRALLENPDVLATRTPAVRAYPDLSLTFPGYPAQRPNASSLLFRRREVHELIGDFDAVRKSADMEYPRRLQALRPGSVKDVDDHGPMAITQLRAGSLSRSDAVPGWIRWTRLSYHDAYVEWHERIRIGTADSRLLAEGPRPFPMPDPTWSPWRESTEYPRESFDVVFLGDWRTGRGPHRQVLDEMRLLSSRGLRVGVAHAEAPFPLPRKRQPRARPVQRLVNSGIVELTHLDRPSDVGLLVVAHADVLTYLPDVEVGARASAVVVLVDDTATVDAAVAEADEAAREVLGAAPVWVARHDGARDALQGVPGITVDDTVLPFAVDPAALLVTDRRLVGGPAEPVLGHHLPDEAARWPRDADAILDAYPPEADVRLLQGTSAAARALGRSTHPVGWISYDGVDLPTRTFLSRLDFFVYVGVRDQVADHALLEAMAAGCVPVVSGEFEPVAGDGARYVTPGSTDEVSRTVAALRADPEEFRRVQGAALSRAAGAGGYVDGIRRHLGAQAAGDPTRHDPQARPTRPTPDRNH